MQLIQRLARTPARLPSVSSQSSALAARTLHHRFLPPMQASTATAVPERLASAPNYELLVAASEAVRLASLICTVSDQSHHQPTRLHALHLTDTACDTARDGALLLG